MARDSRAGFHSQVGWIAFNCVAFALLLAHAASVGPYRRRPGQSVNTPRRRTWFRSWLFSLREFSPEP